MLIDSSLDSSKIIWLASLLKVLIKLALHFTL